jgi:hypothetical protein
MYLAVQLLLVSYGKNSRGREPAKTRPEVPRGLPLPRVGGRGVLHESFLSHHQAFAPQSSTVEVPINADGVVAIKGGLCVRIIDEKAHIAEHHPTEPWRTRSLVAVPVGAWARALVDECFVAGEARWTRELIVNAGLFTAAPPESVFLGEPSQLIDARGGRPTGGGDVITGR